MSKTNSRYVTHVALVAAAYTALSVALSPISFGIMQVRVSEALCLLPVICPSSVWGVTIGCILTNIIGIATGANVLGAIDVVLGPLATFLAAILTRSLREIRFKKLPILSSLSPVILNGLVVGGELAFSVAPNEGFLPVFASCALSVALGEFISCTLLGLALLHGLENNRSAMAFFDER